MIADVADYGPFAPLVGYATAIMATAAVLFSLWGGKMEKWRPPDEDLPGGAQAIVLLMCGVGIVVQWYIATPGRINGVLGSAGGLAVACAICFLKYSGLLSTYVYTKKIVSDSGEVRDERILGGRELLPEAEKKREKLKIDTQTLFEGAAYSPGLLWSRESRQWVKQRVLMFFILTLVLGTSALTGAGFATQVLLTKEDPVKAAIPDSASDPNPLPKKN